MNMDESQPIEVVEPAVDTSDRNDVSEKLRAEPEKSEEQKNRETEQFERRKKGNTPSSSGLPRVDLVLPTDSKQISRERSKGDADISQAPGDSPAKKGESGIKVSIDWPAETPPTADAAALEKLQKSPEITAAHKQLDSSLARREKTLDPHSVEFKQIEQLKKDREDFERRASSAKPPLSAREVADTEKAIAKLLDAQDKPGTPTKQSERLVLASQVMHHCAYPSGIEQGSHASCSLATSENRIYSKNPSVAAALVTEVATTGAYTVKGEPPKQITIHPDSLKPVDGAEESYHPPRPGKRSYASQVFQVTAANVAYDVGPMKVGDKDYPPGTLEYRQGKAEPGPPPTTGEVLVDRRTNEVLANHPYIDDDRHVDMYNKLIGATPPETGMLIANKRMVSGSGDRVTQITSEEELKKQIEEAQRDNKLPIILKVNTGQEPFFTDSKGGVSGGSGGAHVVTIKGIDADGNVQIDNQWGKSGDHSVKMHELYLATMPPKDAIRTLEKECIDNARSHKVDYVKELELLRLKHAAGDPPVPDAVYDRNVLSLAKQIAQEAKDNKAGVLDKQTCVELQTMLDDVITRRGQKAVQSDVGVLVLTAIAKGTLSENRQGELKDSDGDPIRLRDNYGSQDLKKAAEDVYGSLNWWPESDRLEKALAGKTPSQIENMNELFKQDHNGMTMDEYIRQKTLVGSEEQRKALQAINPQEVIPPIAAPAAREQFSREPGALENVARKEPVDKPPSRQSNEKSAEKVYDSLNWWNDTEKLQEALAGKSPADLKEMDEAFQKQHGKTMKEYIQKELKDDPLELQKALDVLGKKDGEAQDLQRTKLESKLRDNVRDPQQLERFRKDIEDFEHRQPAVTPAERSRFYYEVNRLLEAKGDKALSQEDRLKLAGQVLHNAAHPTDIDQGQHKTCNVSTVEVRTYTREPSAAARLVTDVATTGSYTSKSGVHVDLDSNSLKSDQESRDADQKPGDGSRNYASQIFQITAVNLELQKTGFHVKERALHYPPGTVRYEQGEPTKKNPTGERMIEVATGNEVYVGYDAQQSPGLSAEQLHDVGNEISSNEKSERTIIEHAGKNEGEHTVHVKSEQELKEKLVEMKKNGELPIIVRVDTGNSPFWGEGKYTKASKEGGDHGSHVITVTDFNPDTGLVSVDNQWGNHREHLGGSGISVGDLYLATNSAGSEENINILQKDVTWNRQQGHINTFKELELLRQKKIGGKLTDEEYDRQVQATIEESRTRWARSDNKESAIERQQAEEQYTKISQQSRLNRSGQAGKQLTY